MYIYVARRCGTRGLSWNGRDQRNLRKLRRVAIYVCLYVDIYRYIGLTRGS